MRRFALLVCLLAACLPVRAAPAPVGAAPAPVRAAPAPVHAAPAPVRAAPARPTHWRIVSLAPATTEIVYALGLGGFLVGDTVFCDYPPAARSVPKIGDVNTSYERVLALRPDLVVASDANQQAARRLSGLGLPVLTLNLTSWRGMEDGLHALGHLTGHDNDAARLVKHMEAERKQAADIAQRDTRPAPRVLFVLSASPLWAAGQATFVDNLIQMAGGVNSAGAVHGYAPYSPEALLAHPPDIIVADPQTQAELRRMAAFSTLAAVQNGRMDYPSDPNVLLRPGPRLGMGLLWLARALHPGTP